MALASRAWAEDKLSVALDPRLELVGIVQLLSGDSPPGYARPRIPYLLDAERRFAAFRSHPAVLLSSQPFFGFAFSDRAQILLRLSQLPELRETRPLPDSLVVKAGGRESLEIWLKSLRDFSRDSSFLEGFGPLSQALEPEVSRFREEVKRLDFLKKIEAYSGLPLSGDYRVLLSAFHQPGGVANVLVPLEDGGVRIESVIGPEARPSGIEFWSSRVPGILWHESAHGILDPISELNRDAVSRSAAAFQGLGWECYGLWEQCVREHLVRAVMLRLIARELGEEAAREQLAWEGERKYPYLAPILEKLRLYESSRKAYPTLADFYPRLLEAFPSTGPLPPPAMPLSLSGGEPESRRLRLTLEEISRRGAPPLRALALRLLAGFPAQDPGGPPQDPERGLAEKRRGVRLYLSGRLEEAQKSLEAALKADPRDVEALLSRGVVLQSLRRYEQALASYNSALSLIKPGGELLLADALSSRASLWLDLKRQDHALADLERALAEAPKGWPGRARAEAELRRLRLGVPR